MRDVTLRVRSALLGALALLVFTACAGDSNRSTGPNGPLTVTVRSSIFSPLAGQTLAFSVEARDRNLTPTAFSQVSYQSSDSTVLAVTPTGTGTARAVGTARISALVNGLYTGTIAVTVQAAPTVTIQASSLSATPGQVLTFTAVARGAYNQVVPTTAIVWRSSDPAVLQFTDQGTAVTGHAGVTMVTAVLDATWTATMSVTVHRVLGAFRITVRVIGGSTPGLDSAVARAVQRWSDVVVGPIDPVALILPAGTCGAFVPALTGDSQQNLLIFVHVVKLTGGAAGAAGPCAMRPNFGLPALGVIYLDSLALDPRAALVLPAVIEHEMGHVLGIGIWGMTGKSFVSSAIAGDPRYAGPLANVQAATLGLSATIMGQSNMLPIQNVAVAGSNGAHWRSSLISDVMNEFANGPRSTISVGALADLGYQVDYTLADPWTGPIAAMMAAIHAPSGGLSLLGPDVITAPMWEMTARGGVVRLPKF